MIVGRHKKKSFLLLGVTTLPSRERGVDIIYGIQKGVSWVTLCPHGCRNHTVCHKYKETQWFGSSLTNFSSLKMSFVVDPEFST
jgi:hypothetical protein